MPAKKTKKTTDKSSKFDFQKLVNGSDSYKSLIYGIVTVVVLFIVIALGVRTLQQNQAEVDEGALTTQNLQEQTSKYTVAEGDTLWSIAEKSYNDGFKWNEIAEANNITDATILEEGTQLTIPEIAGNQADTSPEVSPSPTTVSSPTAAASPTADPTVTQTPAETQTQAQKITGNSYKIVAGDTLWDISVRAYGNGYKWVELARVNNIVNPDLIYPEVAINLPR